MTCLKSSMRKKEEGMKVSTLSTLCMVAGRVDSKDIRIHRVKRMNVWICTVFSLSFFFLFQVFRPDMSFGDDSTLFSGGSDGKLIVTLALDKSKVFQGESIPFTVTVTHTFQDPVSVASFLDTNRSLKITLKNKQGKIFAADQMSHKERDGISLTERRTPEGLSLPPGGSSFSGETCWSGSARSRQDSTGPMSPIRES